MELSARLYNCVNCNTLVNICSHCDRNNVYCGSTCSRASRIRSCRLSSCRYQRTLQGRQKHADRQRRYRERQKNKVTHHTSPILPLRVVLPRQPNERILTPVKDCYHCHFCRKPVSLFLRRSYLRYAEKKSLPRLYFGRKPL